MKIFLIVLSFLILLLSVTGCSCSPPKETGEAHTKYIHDGVHKVGIWYVDAEGSFGGRAIFVLPDSQYDNPGAPWPEK